jgi:hypothetical protein
MPWDADVPGTNGLDDEERKESMIDLRSDETGDWPA